MSELSDQQRLNQLKKKVEQLQSLKRKIEAGEIPKPTPEQQARVKTLLEKMEEFNRLKATVEEKAPDEEESTHNDTQENGVEENGVEHEDNKKSKARNKKKKDNDHRDVDKDDSNETSEAPVTQSPEKPTKTQKQSDKQPKPKAKPEAIKNEQNGTEVKKEKKEKKSDKIPASTPIAPIPVLIDTSSIEQEVEKIFSRHPGLKEIEKLKELHQEGMKLKQSIVFGKIQPTEEIMDKITKAGASLERAKNIEAKIKQEKAQRILFLKKSKITSQIVVAAVVACLPAVAEQCKIELQLAKIREAEEKAAAAAAAKAKAKADAKAAKQRAKEEAEAKAKEEEDAKRRAEEEAKAKEEAKAREKAEKEAKAAADAKAAEEAKAAKAKAAAEAKAAAAAKAAAEEEEDEEEEPEEEEPAPAPSAPQGDDDDDGDYFNCDMFDETKPPPKPKKVAKKKEVKEVPKEEPEDEVEEEKPKPKKKEKVDPMLVPVPLTFIRNSENKKKKSDVSTREDASSLVIKDQAKQPKGRPKKPKREYTLIQKAAVQRLQKEAAELLAEPLETVKALPTEEDIFEWHVNVSPKSGHFAGHVVHLMLLFSDDYPSVAPKIQLSNKIPHRCCLPFKSYYELCFNLGGALVPRGWNSSLTVRSICMQLQNIFHDEQFVGDENQKEFQQEIRQALTQFDKYENLDVGHSIKTPWPPVATFNGPLVYNKGLKLQNDELVSQEGKKSEWKWGCSNPTTTTTSTHRFRTIINQPGPARIGWCITSYDGSVPLGDAEGTVCITSDGEITSCGKTLESTSPLNQFDVVECAVNYDKGVIQFLVNGSNAAPDIPISDFGSLEGALCPVLALQAPSAVELQVLGDQPQDILEVKSHRPAPQLLSCAFSRLNLKETILGIGVHVERAQAVIKELSSGWDLISQNSFTNDKIRQGTHGERFSYWLPLPLNKEHANRTVPHIQTALVTLSRDPTASTLYTPPFRPTHIVKALPKLAASVLNSIRGHYICQRLTDRLLFAYYQLHYTALLISEKNEAINREAQQLLLSGNLDVNSPLEWLGYALLTSDIKQVAASSILSAIGSIINGSHGTSDQIFHDRIEALRLLIIQSDIIHHYLGSKSLKAYHGGGGIPDEQQYLEFFHRCKSTHTIKNWKGFCERINLDEVNEDSIQQLIGL